MSDRYQDPPVSPRSPRSPRSGVTLSGSSSNSPSFAGASQQKKISIHTYFINEGGTESREVKGKTRIRAQATSFSNERRTTEVPFNESEDDPSYSVSPVYHESAQQDLGIEDSEANAPLRPEEAVSVVMSRKSVLINPADVLDPRDMPPLEDELEQLSIQASNSTSKEDMGLYRRFEILGVDPPNMKSDYQVRIAIQYSEAKNVVWYKKRIHPSCTGLEIINDSLQYLMKKVTWQPPNLEVLNYFGLYIPAYDQPSDDTLMDPKHVLWKYGIPRDQLVRLVLRPKGPKRDFETVCLKVKVDNEPPINLLFYTISTIAKVVQKIKSRLPAFQGRDPPLFGLYLYRESKGFFLEDNKTLADYAVKTMDIIHWKRRSLIEFALRDNFAKRVMFGLDTSVGDVIAEFVDWLKLPTPNYSLIKGPGRLDGVRSLTNAILRDASPLKAFRLRAGDSLELRCNEKSQSPQSILIVVNWTGADQASLTGAIQADKKFVAPSRKPGENFMCPAITEVMLYDQPRKRLLVGDLYFTNYRICFVSFDDERNRDFNLSIPLTTVSNYERVSGRKYGIEVECKDFRSVRFQCVKGDGIRKLILTALSGCLYPNRDKLYAYAFREPKYKNPHLNGWNLFNPIKQFERLGVGRVEKAVNWRISKMNQVYAHSATYPSIIAVPATVTDDDLVAVFKYRSKGRIPALSWIDHRSGASITRCSQPLVGFSKKSSPADAKLINAIRESVGKPGAVLHMLDARPRANAWANMAMGGGFESVGGSTYPQCELEFLDIENIHVMRSSLAQLKYLIESSSDEKTNDSSFLAKLDSAGWMGHVKLVLEGGLRVVKHLKAGEPVVLHCSDGWDRTSQLSSVAMLIIDPYYRTLHGFEILIEQEWLSFGHKFAQRIGHMADNGCDKNHQDGERAPIFVQFIDCVYQMLRQFPFAFEFNEHFLLTVLEHAFSCHFGTFLFNCERERVQANLNTLTESMWSYINDPDYVHAYVNAFYNPVDSVLEVSAEMAELVLWKNYYRRWYSRPVEETLEQKANALNEENMLLKKKVKDLQTLLDSKK